MQTQFADGASPVDARQVVDLELLKRVRTGDERATEILLNRYRWLARHRTGAWFMAGSTEEDLLQEAMIGLFKAIRNFDIDLDMPFSAFADLCIKRQIATALKTANRYKHLPLNSAASFDPVADQDDDYDMQIADILVAPATLDPGVLVISTEQIEDIRDHLTRTLTGLEKDVLELSLQGLSYKQMAEALDWHRKGIDNALQRIRSKLRAHLNGSESA